MPVGNQLVSRPSQPRATWPISGRFHLFCNPLILQAEHPRQHRAANEKSGPLSFWLDSAPCPTYSSGRAKPAGPRGGPRDPSLSFGVLCYEAVDHPSSLAVARSRSIENVNLHQCAFGGIAPRGDSLAETATGCRFHSQVTDSKYPETAERQSLAVSLSRRPGKHRQESEGIPHHRSRF
jgi:hypothetical protein